MALSNKFIIGFNASINISRASVNMPIVSDSNKNLEIQATNF